MDKENKKRIFKDIGQEGLDWIEYAEFRQRITGLLGGILIGAGATFLISLYIIYSIVLTFANDHGYQMPWTSFWNIASPMPLIVTILLVVTIVWEVWDIARIKS